MNYTESKLFLRFTLLTNVIKIQPKVVHTEHI